MKVLPSIVAHIFWSPTCFKKRRENALKFSFQVFVCILVVLSCSKAEASKCYGRDPCSACRTCSSCQHCAVLGGQCGVCKRQKNVFLKTRTANVRIAKVKRSCFHRKALKGVS